MPLKGWRIYIIYTRVILSIYIDTNAELIASGSESFCGLNRVLVKKKIRLQSSSDHNELSCRGYFPVGLGCAGVFWVVLSCLGLF